MANIKNELNNIKSAIYGKDVRGSIHDGIDAINKEVENTTGRQVDLENTFDQLVINAGNSNAEIVDARVKSDGTSYSKLGDRLNEVDSQLAHIKNNGFVIVDNLGILPFETEEEAIANIYNTDLLQELLDENKNLQFNNGYYAFNKEFCLGNNSIIGVGKTLTNIIFPNSKAISFTKETYISNNIIKDLSITSKLNTIDFKNEDTNETPYNVYQNYIGDLFLKSNEGHCVYAGNNRGKGGDQLIFEQVFNNIRVTAPNGAGFYGIGGLGVRFEKISDAFSIKNIFQNCYGQFYNINTSFAGAEYFLYFDEDCPANYGVYLDFYNVNMEDVTKSGIYIESDKIDVSSLIMNRTTYSPPSSVYNHDVPPFYIPNIKYLELKGDSGCNKYPDHFDTDKVQSVFYCWNGGASINISSETEVDVWSSIFRGVITYNASSGYVNSVYAHKYGKSRHKVFDEFHANTLVGGRTKKIMNISDGRYSFQDTDICDELNYTITDPLTLPYISMSVLNGNKMISIVNNKNSTADLTVKHSVILLLGGIDAILKPGEELHLIHIDNEWVQIVTAINLKYYCGSTSRPTNVFPGFTTFDGSIGKPIWWSGSAWKDSQGNNV